MGDLNKPNCVVIVWSLAVYMVTVWSVSWRLVCLASHCLIQSGYISMFTKYHNTVYGQQATGKNVPIKGHWTKVHPEKGQNHANIHEPWFPVSCIISL